VNERRRCSEFGNGWRLDVIDDFRSKGERRHGVRPQVSMT
jgi:hypothetical protein